MANPFYEYQPTLYVQQYAPYPVQQYGQAAQAIQGRVDTNIAAWNELDVLSANFKDQLGVNDQYHADEARKIIDDELGALIDQKKWLDIDYKLPEVYKKAIGKNRDLIFSMQQFKKMQEGVQLKQEYGAEGVDFNDPANHTSVVTDPATGEKQYIPYTLDVEKEAKHSIIAQQLLGGMPQESIQEAFKDMGEGWEESITTSGISRNRLNRVAKETVDAFKDADPQYLKVEAHKAGINVAGMSGDEAEQALVEYYNSQGMDGQAVVDKNVYDYVRKANEKLISTSTGISSRQVATGTRGNGEGGDPSYSGIFERVGVIDVKNIAKSQADLDRKISQMKEKGDISGAEFLERQKGVIMNAFIKQNPKYADIYKNKPTSGNEDVDLLVSDIFDSRNTMGNLLGDIVDVGVNMFNKSWEPIKKAVGVDVSGEERKPRFRIPFAQHSKEIIRSSVDSELYAKNLSGWLGRDVSSTEAEKIRDYAMEYYDWQNSGGIKMDEGFDDFIDNGAPVEDVVQVFSDPKVAKEITYHVKQMDLAQLGDYDIISAKTNKQLKDDPINPRDLEYVGIAYAGPNSPPQIEVFDTKETDPDKQTIRLIPRTNNDGLVNYIFDQMGEEGQVQKINYQYYNEKITRPMEIAPGINIAPVENSLTSFYLERGDETPITIGDYMQSLIPSPDDKGYSSRKKYATHKYNQYLNDNNWDGTDIELQRIMDKTLTGGKELVILAQEIYRANLKK